MPHIKVLGKPERIDKQSPLMLSALATCLLLLVYNQNFLGSNVDRTVANAD